MSTLKPFLLDPIPEIFHAARSLDAAVSAHLLGDAPLAAELIRRADLPAMRDWTNALWGKGGPKKFNWEPAALHRCDPAVDPEGRAAGGADAVDGGEAGADRARRPALPVLRHPADPQGGGRARPRGLSGPGDLGRHTNATQHAAFQALWLQYDHLVPHARGGTNAPNNMLITCAPCNYGRWHLTIAEVGLADPRERAPVRSPWDGLERFR